MKKSFNYYLVAWVLLLVVWCAAVFLVRPVIPGYVINYDARFWIAWVFIVIAFAGNLICTYAVFKSGSLKKLFYNIQLISISCTSLIMIFIIGSACMLIPNFPAWVTAIVCFLIFAFNAAAVLKVAAAADAVEKIDEKIKIKTSFIKKLTVDAEGIMARAKNEEAKNICRKLCEEIRYSDSMSSPELSVTEAKITVKMDELSSAVSADDIEKVRVIAEEAMALVGDRNRKCKGLK